ncbi:MAG: zinc-binding dehydrogenase [Dehalococcoidia bacterium]|nr:zinc-binding dehydrogenase [Dehalococcoidia bacterium]
MTQVLAAVKVDAGRMEVREFPEPEVAEDSAILKVEAAGMCGAYEGFKGPNRRGNQVILGHENAGVIYKAGRIFKERNGVTEGDLVALEEYIPCMHCEWCRIGEYRHCWECDSHNNPAPARFGGMSITAEPFLWGGYSQLMYLPPNSILHKLPSHVTADEAALALPIGNGVQWAHVEGEAGPGKTIVIQGPGPKGLGCTLASKIFGASCIIVTGLTKDAPRLEAAKSLGADFTIDVQKNDFTSAIKEIVGERGVDAVVDCTSSHNPVIFTQSIDIMKRRGGIIVTQNYDLPNFSLSQLTGKYITLRACRGHSYASVATGLEWIASGKYPLKELLTHRYPLAQSDVACLTSGGEGEGAEDAVSVMINPWM